MANVEYVTRPLKITYSGVFSLNDLMNIYKAWCNKHNFTIIEDDHAEVHRGEGKDYLVKFHAERDEDDYHESWIEVVVRGENLVSVKRQDQRCVDGKITVKMRAILNRDIKTKWKGSWWQHFWRTVWDKYGFTAEHKVYHAELAKEVKDLYAEFKSFFNVEKLKV